MLRNSAPHTEIPQLWGEKSIALYIISAYILLYVLVCGISLFQLWKPNQNQPPLGISIQNSM